MTASVSARLSRVALASGLTMAACTSSSTAPSHPCGTCAGTCAADRCVETLASGQVYPGALAVSSGRVVWVNGGQAANQVPATVQSIAAGGGSMTQLASATAFGGVAADATYAYWTASVAAPAGGSSGSLDRAPLAGGTAETIATGQNSPSGIAIDSANAYFAAAASGSPNGNVMKAPLDGGAPVVLAMGGQPDSLAVDSTTVYWADVGFGTIQSVPIAGGSSATVALAQPDPTGIAVLDGEAFWVTGGGNVVAATTDGGAPTSLATGQSSPTAIAVDAVDVYWANAGTCPDDGGPCDGSIMKVGRDGGTPIVLASQQASPGGIAVDDSSVYFTTRGSCAEDGGACTGAVVRISPK
jgi:hypothetical protein